MKLLLHRITVGSGSFGRPDPVGTMSRRTPDGIRFKGGGPGYPDVTQEALVMPHHHLALDLLGGFQGDAHHDHDGGAAERQAVDAAQRAEHAGEHRDHPRKRAPIKVILCSTRLMKSWVGLTGTVARIGIPAEVIGHFHRIVLDGDIEKRESDDQQEIQNDIHRMR